MLGLDIARCILAVEIVRFAEDGKARLRKIALRGQIQVRVVRFKPQLAAGRKDLFVGHQLPGVGLSLAFGCCD